MTVKVNCPNPECLHHKKTFSVVLPSPIAKKGGDARWSGMTDKQKKAHIARMTKARLGMSKGRKPKA